MTAYQIPTENEPTPTATLQQQPFCSRKRFRTVEQDQINESMIPPEKVMRLHEAIANESMQQQDNGDFIDVSKSSTRDIVSAYKRIWDNLDLSKPGDAKLEPFIWQKIRHYQQMS